MFLENKKDVLFIHLIDLEYHNYKHRHIRSIFAFIIYVYAFSSSQICSSFFPSQNVIFFLDILKPCPIKTMITDSLTVGSFRNLDITFETHLLTCPPLELVK